MKRLLSFVLVATLITVPAGFAATKKIPVKSLKLLTTISNSDEFSGIVVSGATIILYGVRDGKAYAKAINTSGQELWTIQLESPSTSIATAGVVDNSGNIWIAGSMSLPQASATPSPSISPLNPDSVVNPPEVFNAALNVIGLWKIEAKTSVTTLYSAQQKSPVLVTSVAIDKNGISLVGITQSGRGSSGFVINANLQGEFGQTFIVGEASTTLESIVRNSDGTVTVVGASAETLGGKKRLGLVDGVIIKIVKSGSITTVVRSSAPKAMRNWSSATSSLLLGGEVTTNTKSESAITKFSKTFSPTWTYRFASTGLTLTSSQRYAFFSSTEVISQLRNWAPKKPQPILIVFDDKGAITGAFSSPADQQEVVALVESKELGTLCLTSKAETTSIFTLP